MNVTKYLAVFPDSPANRGKILCLPFYQNGGKWWYESVWEIDWEYYYSTKVIHKKDARIPELVLALRDWHGFRGNEKFLIMEKVMR